MCVCIYAAPLNDKQKKANVNWRWKTSLCVCRCLGVNHIEIETESEWIPWKLTIYRLWHLIKISSTSHFFSSIHIENSLVHSQLAIFSINYNQKTRICVTDQRNWCRVCIASEKQSKKRTKKRRKNNNNNNNVFWKWIRDYLQTERQALYIHTLDGYTSTKTHTLCLLHFMFCYYFLCLRWTWAAVASFANDSECIYILMVMLYVVYMPHNSRISVRSRPPQPFPRSNDFRECLCTRNGTGDERERDGERVHVKIIVSTENGGEKETKLDWGREWGTHNLIKLPYPGYRRIKLNGFIIIIMIVLYHLVTDYEIAISRGDLYSNSAFQCHLNAQRKAANRMSCPSGFRVF